MPEPGEKTAKRTAPKKPAADAAPEHHPEDDLSYEDAREQLAEVVHTLEQGGTTLEESISLWERGERLARTCQHRLDGARERLDAVMERESD